MLQAHELSTHLSECPKRGNDDPIDSIPIDVIKQIAEGRFHLDKATLSWECPVCGQSTEIHEPEEYSNRPLKICDDCILKLKFVLNKYQKE
jgi:hypothetical protein